MEKRIEIVNKDNTYSRITVAKDRVTIKLNKQGEMDKEKIIKICMQIAEDLKDEQLTTRGQLIKCGDGYSVSMSYDKGKVAKMFKF